ncbi:hypothetical protein PJM29_30890, partial [Mycobacterium kansasii]
EDLGGHQEVSEPHDIQEGNVDDEIWPAEENPDGEEDPDLTAAQGGKEETQESREAWARQQESFEESKKNGQNLIQEESEESESAPENVGD